MKNTKTNAKGTAKTPKATKSVAVTETVETAITPTDEAVLTPSADITAVVETTRVCARHGGEALELNDTNFSPLQSGGFAPNCKPCNVIISKEWTSRPEVAEMRKVQARARQLTTQYGIPVLVPSAKGFDINTALPLMTIEHTVMPDGSFVIGQVEGGEYHPSVDAESIYTAQVEAKKAERQARQAELDRQAKLESDKRKADREAKRIQREADAKVAKEKADADREAKKAKRELDNAEKARLAKEEKAQKALVRQAESAQKALDKKAKADADREAKAAERLRLAAEKATATASTATATLQNASLENLKAAASVNA